MVSVCSILSLRYRISKALELQRPFGTKRVRPSLEPFLAFHNCRQRRRSRGRILQLKETHYEPKEEGYQPLPLSLLASGPIRRVLSTRTVEAGGLRAMAIACGGAAPGGLHRLGEVQVRREGRALACRGSGRPSRGNLEVSR